MPPDPSGWPWPLNAVQSWFENLWTGILEGVTAIVKPVSDWIWDAVKWVKDRLTESVGWVWDQVKPALEGLWTSISDAFTAVGKTIGDWVTGAIDELGKGIAGIGTALTGLGDGITTGILAGLGTVWTSISEGVNAVGTGLSSALGQAKDDIIARINGIPTTLVGVNVETSNRIATSLDGAVAQLGSWVSDALAGVARALGDGLSAFANWFITSLQGLATLLARGVKALMDAVGGIIGPIVTGFMDLLRGSFTTGSPDKELEKAVTDMMVATRKRILDELQSAHKSPWTPEDILRVDQLLTGVVLTAQLAVHGAASAASIEILGTRLDMTDVVEKAIDVMSFDKVVGASITLPIEIALLQPLRYSYNAMFRPVIPSLAALDQMLFEENIGADEWRQMYRYHGWREDHIDAWYKTMFREPSQLTLLRMLADPEVDEAWVRKKLREIGFTPADVDELIGYKRRLLEAARLSAYDTEKGRLITNAKNDFVLGFTVEATLRASLAEIGLDPDEIEYHVADALGDRERAYKKALLAVYDDAYGKDLLTEDELHEQAEEIIKDSAALNLYMQKAYIAKFKKPKA